MYVATKGHRQEFETATSTDKRAMLSRKAPQESYRAARAGAI